MTIDLFPEAGAHSVEPEPADPSDSDDRWVLHRAGILNVWQYDRLELRFAGGRMLLRGKNGAGKSKALEILLPFLFDGDTRLLDATGRDRTTVTWLMTAGRPNGNHVGYVWLELRCGDAFLTLGAGLKASSATRRSDSWFFVTDKRVGVDLALDVAGECLSIERLKAAVGEEAVTASGAEHRRRVGRHLFGLFDEARYRNLLHLLHRLRDPNIGNRVEAGELANVLTDSLPPIDDRVLLDAAGHFDDLDAIRDQVDRADRTARALGEFLGAYRGYARTVLARQAAAVEAAEAHRGRAARTTRQLVRKVEGAGQAADEAQAALRAFRQERTDREAERRELERSDGYRAHLDLADRQDKVAALDAAASIAEAAAERADAAHHRARADVDNAAGDVQRSLARVREAGAAAAGFAADAGLDPALLGAQPTTAADGDLDPAELAQAEDRARAAHTLVHGRRQRASVVRARAVQAERAERDASVAEERAATSEADVERDREAVAAARAAHDAAEVAWADAITAWLGTGLPATLDTNWAPVRERLATREGEPTWPATVLRVVSDCLAPPLRAARTAAAADDVAVTTAERAMAEVEARLADVETQAEAHPEPARHREAVRDPAAGAPFYELVDVAPGVGPADAAGIESALEAAGLLDAWIHADGLVMHPDTCDTLLRADIAARPGGVATLADVLVPTAAAGSPVGADTVAAVLRAVGLGEQPDAPAWVTTGGRWSLGVLHGAWRKDTVEYLGASARRATRERILAEIRAEAVARQADLAGARSRAEASAAHRDAVEALPATLSTADAIDAADREVRSAERNLAAVRTRHDADRRRAEEDRATANRLAAAVAHEATSDGLPTTVGDLDAVLAALDELRQLLAEHRRALDDLARDGERLRHRRAAEGERGAEASDAKDEARGCRATHATAAHELATLQAALSATVEAVLADHERVSARGMSICSRSTSRAEEEQRAADKTLATAEAQLEEARHAGVQADRVLADAGAALTAAVGLPGVLLAAAGTEEVDTAGDGPVALAVAVGPLVDGDDAVSDGVILSRYDRLSDALAGGYDTAIDEVDGVKVVHVADDTGRQPLAIVAARLAEEADAARGRLAAREQEVLERFLLRELADELRSKLLDAHDLVTGTNRTLATVRTSHGKGAHLEWKLRDDTAAPAAVAARLLLDDLRDEEADGQLRRALLALIDAERAADPSAGYEQHLRAALDYRTWHRFTVKVTDAAHPGSSRTLSNRLGLSQGEQRVLSYLALFAAAAAHFEAIARDTPTAPRLLLLDDAFAKVDEPTHAHLLGLLVELGLDFVVTSERMWGCFPTVPSLEIYEAVRDPAHPGVALVHFRWDGRQRHLAGV
jgi:uncharacterized protein (TIGR02680 family)